MCNGTVQEVRLVLICEKENCCEVFQLLRNSCQSFSCLDMQHQNIAGVPPRAKNKDCCVLGGKVEFGSSSPEEAVANSCYLCEKDPSVMILTGCSETRAGPWNDWKARWPEEKVLSRPSLILAYCESRLHQKQFGAPLQSRGTWIWHSSRSFSFQGC